MLAYIVVVLVAVYIVLDRTGLLADLTGAAGGRAEGGQGHPELVEEGETDPDEDRRLEVFEEFIDQIDPSSEDE